MTWLRLIRSRRVGPTTFYRLIEEHGDAAAALAELPAIAKAAGVEDYEPCPRPVAREEIKAGRMAGAVLIPFGDPRYPALLAETEDAPPLLWALGRTKLLAQPKVAVIGARNASSIGTRMARRLSRNLAASGQVIVSGLARGIDATAHDAALEQGTIAVMAGGVDVVYPKENAVLAQEIAERGLRLSEQPPGMQPLARHFPQRNRIVAGLCPAVVVIEAAAKSGSLGTARVALDLGRDVLAVPGHPFEGRFAGCNMLIRDGATLVRNSDDVLEAIASVAPQPVQEPANTAESPAPAPRRSRKLNREILGLVTQTPLTEDRLARDLKQPASVIGTAVMELEMAGQLERHADGRITLKASA